MVKDRNHKHRNKPDRMSDAGIRVIRVSYDHFVKREGDWQPGVRDARRNLFAATVENSKKKLIKCVKSE